MTEPASAPADDALSAAVRRFQQGVDREGSFRLVYETYFLPLTRFFRRKGSGTEDAFDLTQETLLRIYQGLEEYEDRGRFALLRGLPTRRGALDGRSECMVTGRSLLRTPQGDHVESARAGGP